MLRLSLGIFLIFSMSKAYSTSENLNELRKLTAVQEARMGLIEKSLFAVGSIQLSYLSEDEFKKLLGPGWALCNDIPPAGFEKSKFKQLFPNKKFPDLRGTFIRMNGQNSQFKDARSGVLGELQDDATAVNRLKDKGHNHSVAGIPGEGAVTNVGNHIWTKLGYPTGGKFIRVDEIGQGVANIVSDDQETRPINVSLNFFLKID